MIGYAVGLLGTPYRYGGTSPEGFDCSGFVSYVYSNSAGINLPHSSKAMYSVGKSVETTDLQSGDLVFFTTSGQQISHVGIYIGNRQFIHAASMSTKRVVVASLDEAYYAKRYNGARRILDNAGVAATVALN